MMCHAKPICFKELQLTPQIARQQQDGKATEAHADPSRELWSPRMARFVILNGLLTRILISTSQFLQSNPSGIVRHCGDWCCSKSLWANTIVTTQTYLQEELLESFYHPLLPSSDETVESAPTSQAQCHQDRRRQNGLTQIHISATLHTMTRACLDGS